MRTDDEIKKVIARNIKMLREEKNLSQPELGRKFYKAKTTVSTWERAESMPDAVTLYNLAMFFGKPLSFMYGDPVGPDLREDEAALLEKYNMLNVDGQEKVRGYVSDLAGNVQYKKDTTDAPAKTG